MTKILNEKHPNDYHNLLPAEIGTDNSKRIIVWRNVFGLTILHLGASYGLYLLCYLQLATKVYLVFLTLLTWQGFAIGGHRYFSHRSFKANSFLRLSLVILQTLSGLSSVYAFTRDHRVHHKYSETDADPHNAQRGFFFAHIGWLLCKKHPAIIAKGKTLDLSDLDVDPFVMFQRKHYKILHILINIIIPVVIAIYLWNESFINSFFVCYFLRYVGTLHGVFLINSGAHMFGSKPYDKAINPVEINAIISVFTFGEGWHNYHHTFPWDYRAAEFGIGYSLTTFLIDLCAFLGMAYDLRDVNPRLIEKVCLKRGDGSHKYYRKMPNNDDIFYEVGKVKDLN